MSIENRGIQDGLIKISGVMKLYIYDIITKR